MTLPPFASAVAAAVTAFDRLGIPYLVGGSVAALVHGEPRTTQDVDIVVEVAPGQATDLAEALREGFFVDREFLRMACEDRTSCNVVHRDTGLKLDLFVRRDRDYSRTELARGQRVAIAPGCQIRVATAEDCVLTKLEWYRKGGEVSDQQWRDVQGILRTQRGALDLVYLQRWSATLGIADLLVRALGQAGEG